MKDNNRVAVFVDAENVGAKNIKKILTEASNYGDVIIKRVFADWSSPQVSSWKDAVSDHSLIAEQQFCPIKGKNSSDISLIISAVVVLFEKNIDVFILASSDSDFTRLVQELRERGKLVVGFGAKQTAKPFVNAFSEFIYLEEEQKVEVVKQPIPDGKVVSKPRANVVPRQEFAIEADKLSALKEIVDNLIEKNSKALYAQISTDMKNKFADFIPKNYGCGTMRVFMDKVMSKLGSYVKKVEADGTTLYLVPKK